MITPDAKHPHSEWPALGRVLDADALSPGARTLVEAVWTKNDLPERLAHMALLFRSRKLRNDARLLALAARSLAPQDFRIRVLTDWLERYEAPLWHFGIVHDHLRNEAYARALDHYVKPGMTVFEIGTGTGILAMLAARAGAQHVYTCERRADVAEAARAIIERNGFSDRITVIAKDAEDVELGVDLPARADLFVAEIVDNSLLGEMVLPLTELARERFLKPDAILLPRTVSAVGCLVSGHGQHERYRMQEIMGFDLSPFNRFSPIEIGMPQGGGDVEPLSEPLELISFDLHRDAPGQGCGEVEMVVAKDGIAEGIMRWLRLEFGAGIVFENKPPQASAWWPLLHILPRPFQVRVGQRVPLEINHTRDRVFLIPSQ